MTDLHVASSPLFSTFRSLSQVGRRALGGAGGASSGQEHRGIRRPPVGEARGDHSGEGRREFEKVVVAARGIGLGNQVASGYGIDQFLVRHSYGWVWLIEVVVA